MTRPETAGDVASESEKALLIGGHLDSVPNGGWLDGALDELAGLEVLRRIASEFNGRPPVPFVSSIGPMKKARDLAAACSVLRHSREPIPSQPTVVAPTVTA